MKGNDLVVAVLGVSVVLLAGCGGSPGDTDAPGAASVSASTSPEDVVRGYLGALQQHDESAATSLTTAPYSGRDDWAAHPPRIEDVQVAAAIPQSPAGTAGEGHAEVVFVPVTFDLHGGDETMPDGPTAWGYLLVRDREGQPWRIADAGGG